MAGWSELSSCADGVLGEEDHEEEDGNNQWDQKDENDDWEVPGDVFVQNEEKVICDQNAGEHKGENTDEDDSTLDWETSEAG